MTDYILLVVGVILGVGGLVAWAAEKTDTKGSGRTQSMRPEQKEKEKDKEANC